MKQGDQLEKRVSPVKKTVYLRRYTMKWGEYSNKAAEKVNKFTGKILSVRGVGVLLALAAFAVLSGANWKWTG